MATKTLIDLYISISTQEKNVCKICKSEENHMGIIGNYMIPYLTASGVIWRKNQPTMSHVSSKNESNKLFPKIHLALHSNAFNGKIKGNHTYYKPFSVEGKKAAIILNDAEKAIYPFPALCKVFFAVMKFTEIFGITAPIAIIDEMFFHDNLEDATWGHSHMKELAKCKAQAICKILGKTFIDPNITLRPKPIVSRAKPAKAYKGDVLKEGSAGLQVLLLQTRLNELDFDCGKVDGDYGPVTAKAVGDYQRSIQLPIDGIGICGKATWTRLFL